MEPLDNFRSSRDFLADARRDFGQFYRTATPKDTGLMDGLVMAPAALVVGMNTLRDGLDSAARSGLERKCITAE